MIHQGDALTVLKTLKDQSVNCCITSPPYYGLRDYGMAEQIGIEPTIDEYIEKLCVIFDEVKKVLRDDGTCFVNLGDTYKNNGLCQVPSRFAIAMAERGWILRNEIIWHKPNCMPSPASDRFTVDFEKMFFFVKNKDYWFETQYDVYTEPMNRWGGNRLKANGKSKWDAGSGHASYRDRNMRPNEEGRNKRCVWKILTKPCKDAHFAMFPEELIKTPMLAGCPPKGTVLDPFCGSGTSGMVAKKQDKDFIGIELNPEYVRLGDNRIDDLGWFRGV